MISVICEGEANFNFNPNLYAAHLCIHSFRELHLIRRVGLSFLEEKLFPLAKSIFVLIIQYYLARLHL